MGTRNVAFDETLRDEKSVMRVSINGCGSQLTCSHSDHQAQMTVRSSLRRCLVVSSLGQASPAIGGQLAILPHRHHHRAWQRIVL